MASLLDTLHQEIKKHADKKRAAFVAGYFKTGKGQYGEGDVFVGLAVPQCRKIASQFKELSITDVEELLRSPIHEERLIALFILVSQFQKAKDLSVQKEIVDKYLANTKYINNWDLVDSSADKIVGEYLFMQQNPHPHSGDPDLIGGLQNQGDHVDFGRVRSSLARMTSLDLLMKLANSQSLWERRIAMIATYASLAQHDYLFATATGNQLIRMTAFSKPLIDIARVLLILSVLATAYFVSVFMFRKLTQSAKNLKKLDFPSHPIATS